MKFCLFLLAFTLFAQDADNSGISKKSGTTGSIGTVTINEQMYNQLSLRPEIPIGKLGVGLNIYLYFNDEGIFSKISNSSAPNIFVVFNRQLELTSIGVLKLEFINLLCAV